VRQHVLHPEKNAAQVDRDDLVEGCLAGLGDKIRFALDTGVVVEHVGRPQALDRYRGHPLHVLGFRDVGADCDRFAAGLANFARDILDRGLADVGRRDFRSLARKQERGRLAHSRSGPGDESNFSFEFHLCRSSLRSRPAF